MPLYEFQCEQCGEIFEALLGLNEAYPPCPSCKSSEILKLPSLFAFQDRASFRKERERAILKRASEYLKDGKIGEAKKFLEKAQKFNPSDKVKRLAETLEKRKSPKGGFLIKPEVTILKRKG
ncbi:MAG: zinc ribbon domain-containing protein [Caldimicrobium sp.]|nr:zinc ribbon domain-containing protein [Caldimicrobium sp.]MCX7873520.1 zinc ribbon domain-containing protein [Caldimicrobium sp.]MDW8093846.1 FmdB family zinc ribbon protein [Caldimicrobium sp.]